MANRNVGCFRIPRRDCVEEDGLLKPSASIMQHLTRVLRATPYGGPYHDVMFLAEGMIFDAIDYEEGFEVPLYQMIMRKLEDGTVVLSDVQRMEEPAPSLIRESDWVDIRGVEMGDLVIFDEVSDITDAIFERGFGDRKQPDPVNQAPVAKITSMVPGPPPKFDDQNFGVIRIVPNDGDHRLGSARFEPPRA